MSLVWGGISRPTGIRADSRQAVPGIDLTGLLARLLVRLAGLVVAPLAGIVILVPTICSTVRYAAR
jgi:hypothetical protein